MQEFKCFFMSTFFTPLYFLRICTLSFSFQGQNTLFCYAIGKKFRGFLSTFTTVQFFHGLLPCLRLFTVQIFCSVITLAGIFYVPLCLVFHACLFISRILQNENFLTSEKGRQAGKSRHEEPLNFLPLV